MWQPEFRPRRIKNFVLSVLAEIKPATIAVIIIAVLKDTHHLQKLLWLDYW